MSDQARTGNESLIPVAPEFFVGDVENSAKFYVEQLGFTVLQQKPDFAVVALGDAHILLAEDSIAGDRLRDLLVSNARGVGVNVRLMVDDVDAMYRRIEEHGVRIVHEIDDRTYGLRDFIVADSDGYLLRFAAPVRR